MNTRNDQIMFWEGDFGEEYLHRNICSIEELDAAYKKKLGVSRSSLNEEFLFGLTRDIKILEVGCNIGLQLRQLQLLGFHNLYGIDIQERSVEKAKLLSKNINIITGFAQEIPFRDQWFDLVFTSGLLIHIHPNDTENVIKEIYRCSKKYIWGYEYYSRELEEVIYRGHKEVLWKRDFCKYYLENFSELKIVKDEKIKWINNNNINQMFLLGK